MGQAGALQQSYEGVEEASIKSTDSFMMQGASVEASWSQGVSAATCCFHIDANMKYHIPHLWHDVANTDGIPWGLPSGPGRNYNYLALGWDWSGMKYHPSAIGLRMPADLVNEDTGVQQKTTAPPNSSIK